MEEASTISRCHILKEELLRWYLSILIEYSLYYRADPFEEAQ